jgi:COMPASS component SPP1
MCTRKKCKPHGGWNALLTKHVKHQMKELAREAKEKLDGEQRVRESAAGRFVRKKYENNTVRVIESEDEAEDADMVDAD